MASGYLPAGSRPLQRQSVTIKDIANLLGLAHTTVSRALNDHPKISADTKQKVRAAAERMGYITNLGARSMRMGHSRLVGLIVPDVQNEFYGAAARVMAQRCAQYGYQMMLGVSEDDPAREEKHVRSLREGRAAGVLIVPSPAPTETSIALLRQIPTVQFLRTHPKLASQAIVADDFEGIHEGTRHLLSLGHERIGFIGGARHVSTGLRRAAGYEAALRKQGLPIADALIQIGPMQPSFGATALETLLTNGSGITGLIVSSSRQLLGVLQAAQRLGVGIPQALSLIGYGDTEWFEVSQPAVSGIALPVSEMSESATQALFERLDTAHKPGGHAGEQTFATRLILRASTARPAPRG